MSNGVQEKGERPLESSPDCFGGCPECKGNDGYLNVFRAHWFVCHRHKTKWLTGENLFSTWRHESKADWERNTELLNSYRVVTPVFPRKPDIPKDVEHSIEMVLEYLWADEACDWRRAMDAGEDVTGHIFAYMLDVHNWLCGTHTSIEECVPRDE